MINAAILGFGVVGGGIAEVIDKNNGIIADRLGEEMYVKYILDLRDFPSSPYGSRVVHDINVILSDPEVKIVFEAMGGSHPALEFSLASMEAKKSVITSNKQVVASHGCELLAAAAKNGVHYEYEASVGGGIPLIRSLRTSLASDEICGVSGILNGTTNYILTAMEKSGADFDTALKEAQKLGYAEADPTADVDGIDAKRKIIILTAIATGMLVNDSDVYTETMRKVTVTDIDAAKRAGGRIKMLGRFRKSEGAAAVSVCPFIVKSESPLYGVNDVFNGVIANCSMTGDVMYYGRGAGRYPTAAAMVSDAFMISSAAMGQSAAEYPSLWTPSPKGYVIPIDEQEFSFYMRIKNGSRTDVIERASEILGDVRELGGTASGFTEIVTAPVKNKDAMSAAADLSAESVIRIYE